MGHGKREGKLGKSARQASHGKSCSSVSSIWAYSNAQAGAAALSLQESSNHIMGQSVASEHQALYAGLVLRKPDDACSCNPPQCVARRLHL